MTKQLLVKTEWQLRQLLSFLDPITCTVIMQSDGPAGLEKSTHPPVIMSASCYRTSKNFVFCPS